MRIKTVGICGVLAGVCLQLHAQLTLESGQSWTYTFYTGDELALVGQLPFTGIQTYSVTLGIHPGSFESGSQLRCEIVRGGVYAWGAGSPSVTPVTTSTISNVPPDTVSLSCSCLAWLQPDGPGGVRFTMLSGAVTIDTMTLEARVPYSGSPRHDHLLSATMAPVPGPRLGIRVLSPSQTRLTWPTNAIGYRLESAATLPPSSWTTVTNTPSVSGGDYAVNVERTGSQRCFRLRKP